MLGSSSGSSNATRVVLPAVTQTAHGFVAGDVLKLSGTTWSKAIATSVVNATAIAVVESVTTDTFIPVLGGKITLAGLTAGIYYLSDSTAGLATVTAPTTVTSYLVTVMRAVSTTEAYVEIEAPLSLVKIATTDIAPSDTPFQVLRTNAGATGTEWADAASGTGDVSAVSNFGTDNRVIRSDGTTKGVQGSDVEIDDSGNIGPVSDSIPNHIALWDGHATAPKAIRHTAPTTVTTEYIVIWPAAPGTSGQILSVASVTGSTITLQWSTP